MSHAHVESARTEGLIRELYAALRELAWHRMMPEAAGSTLQPTALVHEAYLKLRRSPPAWDSRRHFFGAAANAMRQILVDHARQRRCRERWLLGPAGLQLVDREALGDERSIELLDLSDALDELANEDPAAHEVVQLRWFAGLPVTEIAALLGVSDRTVKRHWRAARLWLLERIDR